MSDIYSRMKTATNSKTDVELGLYLGLTGSGIISMWRKRKKKPYKECELISENEKISLTWLLTGKGTKDKERPYKNFQELEEIGFIPFIMRDGNWVITNNIKVIEAWVTADDLGKKLISHAVKVCDAYQVELVE